MRGFQRNGTSRGFGGRLIAALFIAAFGLFTYMSQVEENPVTKERQHLSLTPAEEIRLGLQSTPEMVSQMGGELPANDPRAKEVQTIGNLLVEKGEAKNSPWRFHFHLLADPRTINAFALPGGQVFITLGLYNQLENEAELAGVLGHEIGHVIERHSAEQLATGQLGQILTVAVGTAASDQSVAPYQVAAVINQAVQMKYSRGDELEADTWGLKLMQSAGFDPRAMIRVMEVLKKASSGGGQPEIFQTHPNPDLRIDQIRDYLKRNPPKQGLSEGKRL